MDVYTRIATWLILLMVSSTAYSSTYKVDYDRAKAVCSKWCSNKNTDMIAIVKAMVKYKDKVDPNLMLAVAITESNLNARARDRKSVSVGIMQVNIKYHRSKFSSTNYYDMTDNIRVGSKVLNDCYVKSRGDITRTLFCYNGGKNMKYVRKVSRHLSYGVFKQ